MKIRIKTVGFLAFLLMLLVSCGPQKEKKNPYEYDLSQLKKTDPAALQYTETKQIKIDLDKLYAVAVDMGNNIYVSGDNVLKIMQSSGQELSTIELEGPARCINVTDGKIYLGITDHIEIYNTEGKRLNSWDRLDANAIITSIAVTPVHVFAADAGNQVVLRYDTSGKLLGRIGKKDPARDIPGLIVPSPYLDVAIGYEGHLWVVNPGLHALENYTADGTLRSSWQRAAMTIDGFCGCCNPTHIAMLPDGSFVTSEKGLPRVKVVSQSGDLAAVVAGPEQFQEGTVGLDLAVDADNRILVLDPMAHAVRIFEKRSNR